MDQAPTKVKNEIYSIKEIHKLLKLSKSNPNFSSFAGLIPILLIVLNIFLI